jgi:hypothetical protein
MKSEQLEDVLRLSRNQQEPAGNLALLPIEGIRELQIQHQNYMVQYRMIRTEHPEELHLAST